MALVQAGSSVSAVDNKGKLGLFRELTSYENCLIWNITIPFSSYTPGDTPLHLASYAAAAAVRTILLEAGADENVENMDGKTPKVSCTI